MINIFQIPANDQSVYYLGQIFGLVGDVLPVSNPNLLLGTMFKVLNTVALSVGTFIVIYATISGVLKTAHEGEFMGRQHGSSPWIPVRMVLGVAALFPTKTGYSMLQILIMWIVMQGIGAADTLWTTVLNYIKVAGSPYASVNFTGTNSTPTASIYGAMQNLFQGLVCQASAKATYADQNVGRNYYYCAGGNNDIFCNKPDADMLDITSTTSNQVSGTNYSMGPSGACGSLTFCDPKVNCKDDPSSLNGAICVAACTAQKQALQNIVPTLGAIANAFVDMDHDYLQFYNEVYTPTVLIPTWIQSYCTAIGATTPGDCCRVKFGPTSGLIAQPIDCKFKSSFPSDRNTDASPPDFTNIGQEAIQKLYWPYYLNNYLNGVDFIETSVNYYKTTIQQSVAQVIMNQVSSQDSSGLADWEKDAQQTGWILAGGYYYSMAVNHNSNLQASIPPLAVNGSDPYPSSGSPLHGFRNNYNAASYVMNEVAKQVSANQAKSGPSLSDTLPPQLQPMSRSLDTEGTRVIQGFMNTVSGNNRGGVAANPLSSIQSFGEGLLITAQVMFAVMLVTAFIAGWTGNISFFALGTGGITGIGPGFSAVFLFLMPVFTAFMSALFVIGGMLSVYVPLIPYIIFTFGAIGWLISVIEGIAAGPLVALAILSPGGEHEILGRASHAIGLTANLFLRPSLMIVGMMAAMLLSVAAVTLVNAGFSGVMGTINPSPGLAELILFMAAYTFLIVTVLNKCFALIHIVPDRVLLWIGAHHGASGGEEQAAGEVKGGVQSAAGTTGGLASQAPKGAAEATSGYKQGKDKREASTSGSISESKK